MMAQDMPAGRVFLSSERLWLPAGALELRRLRHVMQMAAVLRQYGGRQVVADVYYSRLRLVETCALVGRWVHIVCWN